MRVREREKRELIVRKTERSELRVRETEKRKIIQLCVCVCV